MSRREQAFRLLWEQRFRDSYLPESTARAVGYAMSSFANADGSAIRPGIARLMVAASLSRTSVIKGTKCLVAWQWIELVTEATPMRPAEYRLMLPSSLEMWLLGGRNAVAMYREEKREQDADWNSTRRDRRLGIRP